MEYFYGCVCISYLSYGLTICCGICKEEYLDRLKKQKKIKKEYDRFRDINVDIEMKLESNSKLSTIDEEVEEDSI